MGLAFNLRHIAFDQIRRVQTAPQVCVQLGEMKRAHFPRVFFQTLCGGIDRCEFSDWTVQHAFGTVVRAVCIRGMEVSPPLRVYGFREMTQDLFAFMPLTALGRDVAAEHVAHGRAQSLRAIKHDQ